MFLQAHLISSEVPLPPVFNDLLSGLDIPPDTFHPLPVSLLQVCFTLC